MRFLPKKKEIVVPNTLLTNLTANLSCGFQYLFYYCQSHLPYSSAEGLLCIQFACLVFQPRLATRQDRALRYLLAWRMTRISAAKIICIHNKLTKSQFPHNATHSAFVQSKRRQLHKRFARKKRFLLCD